MGVWGEVNTDVKTTEPAPIGMGFRVPLLVVSPWSRGNIVVSETFDHTSTIQLLEERFGFTCPNISPWRRAVAGNLLAAFDFDSAPDYSWPDLPSTDGYVIDSYKDCLLPYPERPAEQSYPEQEPGTRISRALNYSFEVSDQSNPDGFMQVTIENTGANGAAFTLYNKRALESGAAATNPASAVRQYAVDGTGYGAADTAVHALLPATNQGGQGEEDHVLDYDYLLLGPNGFARQFTATAATASNGCGDAAHSGVGVTTKLFFSPAEDTVTLTVTNGGTGAISFTLRDNVYTAYYTLAAQTGEEDEVTFTVQGGETLRHTITTAAGGNWYDFALTGANGAPTCFYRRYAGHMENGRDSISDPAMGYRAMDALKQQRHPLIPDKFRKLSKTRGKSLLTADGNKDAVWGFDGIATAQAAIAANEEL